MKLNKITTGCITAFGCLLLLTQACSTTKQHVKAVEPTKPIAATPAPDEGATLYAAKCKNCHILYKPERFSVRDWKEIMPDMAAKSKLTDAETATITAYLLKNAKT